jgi:hypothetical protein
MLLSEDAIFHLRKKHGGDKPRRSHNAGREANLHESARILARHGWACEIRTDHQMESEHAFTT